MNAEERLESALRRLSRWSLIITVAISALSLKGWALMSTILTGLSPSYIPIAPSTALCFSILGTPFLIYTIFAGVPHRTITALCASLTILIASILLIAFLMGTTIEAEHLGFAELYSQYPHHAGHMSPVTEMMFIIASSGILLLCLPGQKKQLYKNTASFMGLSVSVAGLAIILGYAHGTPLLYGGTIIPVAFPTAVAFFFLGLGIIFASGSSVPLVQLFAGPSMRSRLTRAFLPTAVAFILITDSIHTISLHLKINVALTSYLSVVFAAVIVGIVIATIAKSIGNDIDKANRERDDKAETLRESEERHRTILETSMDGFWRVDKQGRLLEVNQTYCRMSGYSAEELLVMRVSDISITETADSLIHHIQKVMARGEDRFESRHRRRDGTIFDVGVGIQSQPVEGGQLVAFLRDITDQKQAEKNLRDSEERFRKIFEDAHLGMSIASPSLAFEKVNPAFCRMTGYSADELHSMTVADITHPDHLKQDIENAKMVGLGKIPFYQTEKRYIKKSGEVLWGHLIVSSVHDEQGALLYYISMVIDITDRKLSEEEKRVLQERLQRAEKMEALGQLAGGVAHDLNNVLGVTSGYSELLMESIPEGNPTREYAANIMKSSEKAAAIIQDLLTLARRGVSVSEVVDLNRVVSNLFVTQEFKRVKDYHSPVDFKSELGKDLLNIRGSPVHLEKTVLNLVSNAAEAIMGSGEVVIRTENRYLDKAVRGYDRVEEGDYVVLSVSDTGTGISSEDMGKIFEPFFTKKKMGRSGTGLGLSIVWGTVKDHKGYIDVQSIEGKGTAFTLYFPVTRETVGEKTGKIPLEQYLGHGESVLVVDDVQDQRNVATSILTSLGYHVNSASSGEAAVEHLKTN
ncbi:MAG TPA: PAS domain S-box protein, partial [Syntrophales bacterium]|nr:PAS domain S-box protein [Syntrophales bacterium]